jgi:hypothetical protein
VREELSVTRETAAMMFGSKELPCQASHQKESQENRKRIEISEQISAMKLKNSRKILKPSDLTK